MRFSRTIRALAPALLLTLALGAQTRPATGLVEPPTPLLPTDARFTPAAAPNLPPPATDLATAILKEDGLKREDARTVVLAGHPSAWVQAYEFIDATGAFAAYTYFRQGGTPIPHGINATETQKSGELIFLAGTSVVRTSLRPSAAAAALLSQINIALPKISGRRSLAPLLPTMFPARGLDRDTLAYALGPVAYQAYGGKLPPGDLGWDKSAEVAMANYFGKGQLTLLLYPTPQIAGDRGRAVQDDINRIGAQTFGTVKMRRLGPLVGVTSGDLTVAQAQDLLGSLKLNQEVTFDKPMPLQFHTEVRKTYTLLQSISIFTGIGVLAAVLLGIFLGGARAGIRVLQGKPAASEPEFLSINLRDRTRSRLAAPPDPPGPPSAV